VYDAGLTENAWVENAARRKQAKNFIVHKRKERKYTQCTTVVQVQYDNCCIYTNA